MLEEQSKTAAACRSLLLLRWSVTGTGHKVTDIHVTLGNRFLFVINVKLMLLLKPLYTITGPTGSYDAAINSYAAMTV